MCGSITSSLVAFALSAASVVILLLASRNIQPPDERVQGVPARAAYRYLSLFIMAFATIQLVDAFLWFSVRSRNKSLNRALSKYGIALVLAAEILVSYYGAKYFLGFSQPIYEAIVIVASIFLIIKWFGDCAETGLYEGYLYWCNMPINHVLRAAFLFLLLYPLAMALPNGAIKVIAVAGGVSTFLWSSMSPAFGTKWCWSSNFISAALAIAVLIMGPLGALGWGGVPTYPPPTVP